METPAEAGSLATSRELDELLADVLTPPASFARTETPAPALTSEQQYHADISRYTPLGLLSAKHKAALVEQARQGDTQARQDIIHCLLPAVECFATKYYQTYSWVSARLECAEFVLVGNEALCLSLDRALQTDHPYAYLLTAAYHVIRKYAWQYRSLIATPGAKKGSGVFPIPVTSLDAPLSDKNKGTLVDLIDAHAPALPAQASDCQPLHQALEHLPSSLRTVISRLYGMGGMGRERVSELRQDPDGRTHTFEAVEQQKERALTFLYLRLQERYPQYLVKQTEAEYAELPAHLKLVQRLEQAYTVLQASGEKITADRLAKEARVEPYLAGEFLRQRGEDWASQQAQRLEDAYARLLASGCPRTTQRLVKAAHVDWPVAKQFLQHHGIERDRELLDRARAHERVQRLDRAYAELVATGQKITVRSLAKAAQAEPLAVCAYLRAVRGQTAEVPA